MKTLSHLTQTENKTVNLIVGFTLLFIGSLLITFVVSCIVEPSHIVNASF